jgi:hypothetical protein
VQESVEVPEPLGRLVVERLHARFGELGLTDRATVPENPLNGETVIVELPGTPSLTEMLVGLAVTEKSVT